LGVYFLNRKRRHHGTIPVNQVFANSFDHIDIVDERFSAPYTPRKSYENGNK